MDIKWIMNTTNDSVYRFGNLDELNQLGQVWANSFKQNGVDRDEQNDNLINV